ncbi:serine hydrolase domain-containing protein [Kitasatospora sp. NPDC093806]|uniref:serine hydrolase domain-containing protein n=1 Tax=Kitasatospora sp. NPDC093806 TaxID=3155075 RepID=UPI00343C5D21
MREQTWQRFRAPRLRRSALSAATAVAVLTAGAMTAGVLASPAAATATARPDAVRSGLNALVQADRMPAALAAVTEHDGRTRTYTAGVGDLATRSKVPADGQVRIGSNTKTFTAVVVLQLVGEGRIGLEDKVEKHLPGLVRGEGIDGSLVTVRQLLQHTSGLPDYEAGVTDDIIRNRYFDPHDLLDLAFRHKADFAPGTSWAYSNTNYVLAGLIVQQVTGRPLAEEIDRRIVRALGLRHTYFPAPGDRTIREAHPHGYRQDAPGSPWSDITELDPSAGWAAGQMISTTTELNRFFGALLAGDLLQPAQLAQMRTTVPIGTTGAGYGLGLMSRPLSCGGVYWGHGGDIAGFETRGGVTEAGRAATVAITAVPADGAVTGHVEDVVDTALCR